MSMSPSQHAYIQKKVQMQIEGIDSFSTQKGQINQREREQERERERTRKKGEKRYTFIRIICICSNTFGVKIADNGRDTDDQGQSSTR